MVEHAAVSGWHEQTRMRSKTQTGRVAPRGGISGLVDPSKRAHSAKIDKERITILTLKALMQRRKSPAPTRGVPRNVSGPVRFFLETRGDSKPGIALAGDSSVVLLHDHLQSAAERGRTVPGSVKTSLNTRPEALGVPWPLDNPLVCAAAQIESIEIPKHAPSMKLDTVRKIELTALIVEVDPFRRAFAAGIY